MAGSSSRDRAHDGGVAVGGSEPVGGDGPLHPPGWRWRTVRRRAVEVLREQGVVSLGYKVLGELLYRRAWAFEQRPVTGPATVPVAPPEVTLGELTPEEIPAYLALCPDADPVVVRRRLERGERCFVARRGGSLLHAAWVSSGHARIDYLDRTVELAPGDAYLYQVFSAPEARRGGLSVAVAALIGDRLRAAGCRRLLAVVMPENRSGAAAVRSWGYRRCGTLRTIRLGRRRLHLGRFPHPPSAAPDR